MFNPKIVAFCCEQSGVPASEMSMSLKKETYGNLEIRPVPCAGRIETIHLLTALEKGADGVLIFACHEENCQYLRGNIRAKSRLLYAGTLLERTGMEKACKGFACGRRIIRGSIPRSPSRFVQRLPQATCNFLKHPGRLRPRRRSVVEVDERELCVFWCVLHGDDLHLTIFIVLFKRNKIIGKKAFEKNLKCDFASKPAYVDILLRSTCD